MTLSFFDTNVLIYALGIDRKGDIARNLLDKEGRVGVQSLNEFANVTRNKLKLEWTAIDDLLAVLKRRFGPVVTLTETLHVDGMRLARRYRLAIYDALIVAAALEAGCDTLYSEDMHAGLVIDGRLTIVNPIV